MTCEKCGDELVVGSFPFCPHGIAAATVVGDEMDQVIENNGTPHPIRFRSKAALKAHMDAHGLTPFVRHSPGPGTDKSAHTTDWSRGTDAQTLANAKALLSRDRISPDSLPVITVRDRPDLGVVHIAKDES